MDITNSGFLKSVGLPLLCVVLLTNNAVFADSYGFKTKKCGWVWPNQFTLDNDDVFIDDGDDQNYTYGLSASWTTPESRDNCLHTETAQNFILDLISQNPPSNNSEYEEHTLYPLQIGLTNFTPDDLVNTEIVDTERPYASLLFLHSDVYRPLSKDVTLGSGTTFGILGLGIGGDIQNEWHRVLHRFSWSDAPIVQGWHNQVSDGGEPTARITLGYYERPKLARKRRYFDFAYSIDASAGYYTYASAGAVLKLGRINHEALPHDVVRLDTNMGSEVMVVAPPNFLKASDSLNYENSPREFYFFVGARGTAVGYNALLQCQFRDSNHCLDSSDVEPFLTNFVYGFDAPIPFTDSWRLKITWHERSEEHKLTKARTHSWSSISLSWKSP